MHKNHNFTYSLILLPRQKKPIHRIWLSQNQPRSIPFVTKLFTPHFLCICDNSSQRLHKNHIFPYSPILLPKEKKPIHRTWLTPAIPFLVIYEHLQRSEQMGALAAVCTPTLKSAYKKHQNSAPSYRSTVKDALKVVMNCILCTVFWFWQTILL